MRRTAMRAAAIAAGALAVLLAIAALVLASASIGADESGLTGASTWGRTAEFDDLDRMETGQERWSLHETDLTVTGGSRWAATAFILVDRQTGIEYLLLKTSQGIGITPLLDEDGEPERIAEAGAADRAGARVR